MKRVAIIGAGASGLAASRVLQQHNIDFVCYEKGSAAGGLWRFNNDNGQSSAYRSLHINTSKRKMEFDDLPMPNHYPDFPHHEQITEYFDQYIDHFGLQEHLRFGHEIASAEPLESGWMLTFADGRKKSFSHLIVANGHHWDPKWPSPPPPGEFNGTTTHSHYFTDPSSPNDLRGKRVVVVGMGNSAMDIACELSRKGVAEKVWLSCRSGVHIMPKYFGGKVLDFLLRHPAAEPGLSEKLLHLLPAKARRWLLNAVVEHLVERTVGRPEQFGLPQPKYRFRQNHPTVSNEIHARLGSGDLLPKPAISALHGDEVEFEDGTREEADAIVYCTGYHIRFPFFAKEIMDPADNEVALYKRIFDPDNSQLYFVGLVQPLCALMPIAQIQSRLVAAHIAGDYQLPDPHTMRESIAEDLNEMNDNYVKSTRHTIQIDCLEYTWDIRHEMRQRATR
ncbi:MAG: flavin-containing monooxygenase [Gammaproteobacteria bacterium]